MEDKPPFRRGEVVTVDSEKDVMVEGMAFVKLSSDWLFCRLLDDASREDLLKSPGAALLGAGVRKDKEEEAEENSDARTLFVDFDEQGVRYKEWRRFVQESRDYSYTDWPHEGPSTVLHTVKHMYKFGGDPRQWLQLWARQKGIYETDRVMHELRCLDRKSVV